MTSKISDEAVADGLVEIAIEIKQQNGDSCGMEFFIRVIMIVANYLRGARGMEMGRLGVFSSEYKELP